MFFPQRAFHHCTIQSLNYVSLRHLGSICDTDKRHIQHSKSIIFKVMAKFMQRHQVVTVQRFLSLSEKILTYTFSISPEVAFFKVP